MAKELSLDYVTDLIEKDGIVKGLEYVVKSFLDAYELQVTKRVFALALQQLGISYSQLKELIASNEQAQLEWDLCVELQRKNPLLDIMAAQLEVSSAMLDYIFRKANGEDVQPPEEV